MSISTNRATAYAREKSAVCFEWMWHGNPAYRIVWRSDWPQENSRLLDEEDFDKLSEFCRMWGFALVSREEQT